jgi:hypothetical protein
MLSPEEAVVVRDQFSLMKFFPSDPGAKAALSRLLQRMCGSFVEAQWLVDTALDVYSDWPGTSELRALYCSRFKPTDGIEAYSVIFPEGFLNGRPQQQQISEARYQIEAGEHVSTDPELVLVVNHMVQHNMQVNVIRPHEAALRDGESDYDALVRVIAEQRAAAANSVRGPRAATEDEIREVKLTQFKNAKHEETRRLLSFVEILNDVVAR